MADLPSDPAVVDDRLRDFLAAELRQAELDFPKIVRREGHGARGRLSFGVLAAVVAVLAFALVAPRLIDRAIVGNGGTPMGADGLPLTIDGEPVARGGEIGSRLSGGSILAGGTLVLDTSPCASGSARAQLGCGEGWQLVVGPVGDPSAAFILDGITGAPGFVRTSGAPTVIRVHAWAAASGDVSREILTVEAVAWRNPTKGPIPPDASPPEGGELNDALVPDFVSAFGRDGVTIAGYIPKRYLLEGGGSSPGSPSNPPQPEPQPVYGEDLTTLVGHMVPGVGFVALGATGDPTALASVAPSAVSATTEPAPSGIQLPAIAECGRIAVAACARAIALAKEDDEPALASATRIVVDDSCAPAVLCYRLYAFEAVVVFVTAGGDTTGWYAFDVIGSESDAPEKSEPWTRDLPAHIVRQLQGPPPAP
jgi:hypothetical protein